MGKRNSCHPVTVEWLGHFCVNPSLCFKARLSAKQVIWIFWWRWNSLSQTWRFCSKPRFEIYGFWNLEVAHWAMRSWWPAFWDSCGTEQFWFSESCWWIIVHFQELLQNITIHDRSAYYNLRKRVITIYDSLVITILDNCYYNQYDRYYNLRQLLLQFKILLQFTTEQTPSNPGIRSASLTSRKMGILKTPKGHQSVT